MRIFDLDLDFITTFFLRMSGISLVTLKYEDLVAGKDLTKEISEAFGVNGLGALTISGIPGYAEKRKKLLAMGHKLAHLPESELKKLEHEESLYNVGWSYGKEKLGDKPDTAKGSFYGNPLYEAAGTDELRKKYPFFYPKNIWPTSTIPELEAAFKDLGKVMFDAVVLLSKYIDKLIGKHLKNYPPDYLYSKLSKTQKIKGRLLYYYPTTSGDEDNWIGWHNDSGFLTALSSATYVNDVTGEKMSNPDPQGGLWIMDRNNTPVRVLIPEDDMGVQCGECLQIVSGGLLVATPHSVRSSNSPEGIPVGRVAFPVFIDVDADFALNLPEGVIRDQIFQRTIKSKVPPLETRWKGGETFVEFLGETFRAYYEWTKQKQQEYASHKEEK